MYSLHIWDREREREILLLSGRLQSLRYYIFGLSSNHPGLQQNDLNAALELPHCSKVPHKSTCLFLLLRCRLNIVTFTVNRTEQSKFHSKYSPPDHTFKLPLFPRLNSSQTLTIQSVLQTLNRHSAPFRKILKNAFLVRTFQ